MNENRYDTLTGLYNNAYFEEQIKLFDADSQFPLSVIICAIDGLKLINDTLGHLKGDMLFVNAAKLIKDCLRKENIVAKIEGDKIIILLPKTNSQIAQSIIAHIQAICNKKEDESDQESLCVSISMGCATKVSKDKIIGDLLKDAEENMYKQKFLEYKSFHGSLLKLIKEVLFEKSHETEGHVERLVCQSRLLGEALDLSEEQLNNLEMLATLHDIGKVSIDEGILTKTGALNEKEWNEMKKHPEKGFNIAMTLPQLAFLAEEIRCHHERWDGKGYPQGVSGVNIPLLSRIIAVVDTFDALISKRCYREAVTMNEALDEIERNAGTQFDPVIATVFVNIKSAEHEKASALFAAHQTAKQH